MDDFNRIKEIFGLYINNITMELSQIKFAPGFRECYGVTSSTTSSSMNICG
eukprot:UN24001